MTRGISHAVALKQRCRRPLLLSAVCSALATGGCGDGATKPPPTPLPATVTVTTTGVDPDADGYTVRVDERAPVPVGRNASTTVGDLAAGAHTVTLGGLASNCTVSGAHPVNVTLSAGEARDVALAVICAATTGTLELTVSTSGRDLDADGFVVAVDDGPGRDVPANGTVTVAALGPGPHTLRVTGIASNCALDAPLPTPSVTAGATTQVALHVVCRQYLSNAIVYTSGEFGAPEVMVMRLDGSRPERITTDQQAYSAPSISPDAERIAVATRIGGSWSGIYVMDAHGRGLTKVAGRSTFDGEPDWSPDGSKIAFRSESSGPFGAFGRIWVVNADGSGLRQLSSDTEEYTYDAQPAWSPDGSTVLFARSGELYTVGADGTGEALLMSCRLACADPTWSPDGRRIAYVTLTDADGDGVAEGHMDIYVMNADGSGSQRLTTTAAQDDSPAWSPDGTQIVFRRAADGNSQLYRVRADGTDEVKLSRSLSDAQPTWSPVP